MKLISRRYLCLLNMSLYRDRQRNRYKKEEALRLCMQPRLVAVSFLSSSFIWIVLSFSKDKTSLSIYLSLSLSVLNLSVFNVSMYVLLLHRYCGLLGLFLSSRLAGREIKIIDREISSSLPLPRLLLFPSHLLSFCLAAVWRSSLFCLPTPSIYPPSSGDLPAFFSLYLPVLGRSSCSHLPFVFASLF